MIVAADYGTAAVPAASHLDCHITYMFPHHADQPKAQQKPTVIITGASSGLGLAAAKSLADSGQWHVIMVRFPPVHYLYGLWSRTSAAPVLFCRCAHWTFAAEWALWNITSPLSWRFPAAGLPELCQGHRRSQGAGHARGLLHRDAPGPGVPGFGALLFLPAVWPPSLCGVSSPTASMLLL